MDSPGRTFRVFLSSTFSDLEAERNALQEYVFPRLRDLCESRGARFQAIDLRWGVSDEAAGDYQTMRICLDEIERCQQTTPRPNFIILLGDRYGWRPLPAQIPAEEFENILGCLPADAEGMRRQALLRACYRLDENAVEPVLCLQPDDGGCDCAALYSTFEEATADQPPALRLKYVSSATEQEIWCGALDVSEEERASVFCFIRSIEPLEGGEGDDPYIDRLHGKVDADAQARLSELKGRLKRALPKQNFWDYRVLRKDAGITTDHLPGPLTGDPHRDGRPNLCQDVYDALAGVIREEVGRDQEADPLETELASHAAFAQQLAAPQFFTGRAEILAQLAGCLATPQKQVIGIIGASGSGKSSLMAYAAEQARRAHPNARVIIRLIGATPDSANIRLLLQSLCRQMTRDAGGETYQPAADFDQLVSEFWRRLEPPAGSAPLILFLDALDQLSEAENALGLAWLPPALPQNVHFVVSASPDLANALARRVGPEALWKLNPMEAEEGRALLERWLNGAHRTLQPWQRQTLLDGFQESRLPLYLRIAFEQARQWRSWEKPPPLAGNIPELIENLFSRLADPAAHGELLVSRSLGYSSGGQNRPCGRRIARSAF